jgi:hypothetical protein
MKFHYAYTNFHENPSLLWKVIGDRGAGSIIQEHKSKKENNVIEIIEANVMNRFYAHSFAQRILLHFVTAK